MKGTILDFLNLAADKPELAKELADLAARYGFEFSDEVSDEDLESVAGGVLSVEQKAQMEASISRETSMSDFLAHYNNLQERIYSQISGSSKG